MEKFTFAVPCLFGLEGLVGEELRRMGLSEVRVEDRRAFFTGDFLDMARANLRLRMGERVMLLLGRFEARTFEALYQGVKALPLEDLIPRDGQFPVKGYSLNSQLHSVPDCQAIVKKAAVDRLGAKYGLTWLPETGAVYQIRFSLLKDVCEVFLDTSGLSLHKRGYRAVGNEAPLHETMAAAMVNLARYRPGLLLGPLLRQRYHRHRGRPGGAEPGARPGPELRRGALAHGAPGGLAAGAGRGQGSGVPGRVPHPRHRPGRELPGNRQGQRCQGWGQQIYHLPPGRRYAASPAL